MDIRNVGIADHSRAGQIWTKTITGPELQHWDIFWILYKCPTLLWVMSNLCTQV